MNIPNPAQVASARTARLVREAQTPTYSTVTPAREHLSVVEMEADTGYRYWSKPMPDSKVDGYIAADEAIGYMVSDIDHAAKCWCAK